ncbi:methionyl-tRNA formyltransferase [Candidatus Roizmanbacteria bacterium]|nr:methionyl-tRNA formyltransferase [Candidatus Roizmanbacteria bacterium]
MPKLKLAYFGSPSFSAALLEKLILDKSLGIEIALVVTQPDKPVGRKMVMTPSPVKVVAQKYNIPVFDNLKFVYPEERREIRNLNSNLKLKISNLDLCLVYAFGFKQLIPLDLLRAPKMQLFVNIHPSLLPRYRGSSPIAYPILLGENKTGVTLFVMDEKMDHGPIIAQEEMAITLTDVRSDMETKLTDLGFEMVKKFLNSLTREPVNALTYKPQLHKQSTRAPYMTKQDGFIPLPVLQKALKNEPLTLQELPQIIRKYVEKYYVEQAKGADSSTWHAGPPTIETPSTSTSLMHVREDAPERKKVQNLLQRSSKTIYDFWRGMHPWPGLWTLIEGEPPRLDTLQNDKTSEVKLAGKRLKIIDMEYHVETGHAPSLRIKSVQLEGKSPVDFPTFQKAYNIFT